MLSSPAGVHGRDPELRARPAISIRASPAASPRVRPLARRDVDLTAPTARRRLARSRRRRRCRVSSGPRDGSTRSPGTLRRRRPPRSVAGTRGRRAARSGAPAARTATRTPRCSRHGREVTATLLRQASPRRRRSHRAPMRSVTSSLSRKAGSAPPRGAAARARCESLERGDAGNVRRSRTDDPQAASWRDHTSSASFARRRTQNGRSSLSNMPRSTAPARRRGRDLAGGRERRSQCARVRALAASRRRATGTRRARDERISPGSAAISRRTYHSSAPSRRSGGV